MMWVASLAATNLIPNSSTARLKVVGRVGCVQRPVLFSTGVYPWGWRFLTRCF